MTITTIKHTINKIKNNTQPHGYQSSSSFLPILQSPPCHVVLQTFVLAMIAVCVKRKRKKKKYKNPGINSGDLREEI